MAAIQAKCGFAHGIEVVLKGWKGVCPFVGKLTLIYSYKVSLLTTLMLL